MQPISKQFSYVEGVFDMLYYNLSPKIKLRNEEKLSNNIVYKLYPIKDEQINYVVFLQLIYCCFWCERFLINLVYQIGSFKKP